MQDFFACGSSAPVRVEHEGGTAAWLIGTLAVPSVQGHELSPLQELSSYQSLYSSLCGWRSEGLFGQSFSIAPPVQALRGFPCLGSFSVVWCVRHIEGPPWLGSCSVLRHIRHLKEHPGWVLLCSSAHRRLMCQPLYCSAPDTACGEREAMVMAPPSTRDSAVSPCFHGCLGFLHRYFPPQSPPSHPLNLSLPSQQQPLP